MNDQPTAQLVKTPLKDELKYFFSRKWLKFQYKVGLKKQPECGYILHAKRELLAAGYDLDDKEEGPNKWMMENVFELLKIFCSQGHSGFSATYCIETFRTLALYEPLVPLKGDSSEWNQVGSEEEPWYQNNRCSHVFKDANGTAYDGEGYIFRTQDGNCFTSNHSNKLVEFPYVPVRTYVDVESYETDQYDETVKSPGSEWWHTIYPDYILEQTAKLEKLRGCK